MINRDSNWMDGVLIVDKPKGMTSHDVVDFLRRRFALKKVGHAGSLDPIATGVLVLLIGTTTKLSARFMGDDKIYDAALKFGVTTDTLDAEGKIKEEKDINGLDEEKVQRVFSQFYGQQLQVPPAYSAVKHKGKPLYKLARRGVSIEKEPRRINIKQLLVDEVKLPFVSFRVCCSKGTYIRKLCDDIGKRLGCGAHMTALRRLKSGEFEIENSISVDELSKIKPEELEEKLIHIK